MVLNLRYITTPGCLSANIIVLHLSNDGQPTKEASTARKRLLEAFSQYDALAKRIRSLPTTGDPGNSHERVQMAILTRSNLFLQKHMIPLQVSLILYFFPPLLTRCFRP